MYSVQCVQCTMYTVHCTVYINEVVYNTHYIVTYIIPRGMYIKHIFRDK